MSLRLITVGTRHCRLLYIIPAQPELISVNFLLTAEDTENQKGEISENKSFISKNSAVNYRIFNKFDGFFDSKFYFPKRLCCTIQFCNYISFIGCSYFSQCGDRFVQCSCWFVEEGLISIPVVSELILPEIRRRQCRLPTINYGRKTALLFLPFLC